MAFEFEEREEEHEDADLHSLRALIAKSGTKFIWAVKIIWSARTAIHYRLIINPGRTVVPSPLYVVGYAIPWRKPIEVYMSYKGEQIEVEFRPTGIMSATLTVRLDQHGNVVGIECGYGDHWQHLLDFVSRLATDPEGTVKEVLTNYYSVLRAILDRVSGDDANMIADAMAYVEEMYIDQFGEAPMVDEKLVEVAHSVLDLRDHVKSVLKRQYELSKHCKETHATYSVDDLDVFKDEAVYRIGFNLDVCVSETGTLIHKPRYRIGVYTHNGVGLLFIEYNDVELESFYDYDAIIEAARKLANLVANVERLQLAFERALERVFDHSGAPKPSAHTMSDPTAVEQYLGELLSFVERHPSTGAIGSPSELPRNLRLGVEYKTGGGSGRTIAMRIENSYTFHDTLAANCVLGTPSARVRILLITRFGKDGSFECVRDIEKYMKRVDLTADELVRFARLASAVASPQNIAALARYLADAISVELESYADHAKPSA